MMFAKFHVKDAGGAVHRLGMLDHKHTYTWCGLVCDDWPVILGATVSCAACERPEPHIPTGVASSSPPLTLTSERAQQRTHAVTRRADPHKRPSERRSYDRSRISASVRTYTRRYNYTKGYAAP